MNICIATLPQVQLQGVDLFFWVWGQVATVVPIAVGLIYVAANSIDRMLNPKGTNETTTTTSINQ